MNICLQLFWITAESNDKSMLNFLRICQTVFQRHYVILRAHQKSIRFPFLYILANICYSIYIFFIINDVGHLFMSLYIYWLSVFLLWEYVCSNCLSVFDQIVSFLLWSCMSSSVYRFWWWLHEFMYGIKIVWKYIYTYTHTNEGIKIQWKLNKAWTLISSCSSQDSLKKKNRIIACSKILVQAVIEAEKPHDMSSRSRRTKKASGIV